MGQLSSNPFDGFKLGQHFQCFRGSQTSQCVCVFTTKCGAGALSPESHFQGSCGTSKVNGAPVSILVSPHHSFSLFANMSVDFVLDAEGGRVDARAAPQLYTVHEDQQQRHLIPLIKVPTLQVDFDREPENNSSVEED